MEKPDYAPPSKQAVWLSSADVFEAIRRVGFASQKDVVRATCWDIQQQIHKLIEKASA